MIAVVDVSLLFWNTSDDHYQIRVDKLWLSEGSVCRRSCREGVCISQRWPIFRYEYAHGDTRWSACHRFRFWSHTRSQMVPLEELRETVGATSSDPVRLR